MEYCARARHALRLFVSGMRQHGYGAALMNLPKFNIVLPIEVANRELDARLFLSALLAAPDRRIFIGQEDRINRLLPQLQGGVYVGKHIVYSRGNPRRWYDALKSNGLRMVYIHEEGGIYPGDEANWRRVLDRFVQRDIANFDHEDYICNWGDFQSGYYRAVLPERTDRIVTTGHPRFDIYKRYSRFYTEDAEAIRQRLAPFVLVNTNLTVANHNAGPQAIFHPSLGYKPAQPEELNAMLEQWAHTSQVLTAMVALVHRLAREFPAITFVLRPHPSEDLGFYRAAFAGVANIIVEHSGPVGPWILASEALIHDGCTTAVEAYLLGKTPIAYKPLGDQPRDVWLPNALSYVCHDAADVVSTLNGALGGGPVTTKQPAVDPRAVQILENLRQDGMPALIAVVEQALAECEPANDSESTARARAREVWTELRDGPRALTRKLSGRRRLREYNRQKFPGFRRTDIAAKCARVRDLTGRQFICRYLSPRVLLVESGE